MELWKLGKYMVNHHGDANYLDEVYLRAKIS